MASKLRLIGRAAPPRPRCIVGKSAVWSTRDRATRWGIRGRASLDPSSGTYYLDALAPFGTPFALQLTACRRSEAIRLALGCGGMPMLRGPHSRVGRASSFGRCSFSGAPHDESTGSGCVRADDRPLQTMGF